MDDQVAAQENERRKSLRLDMENEMVAIYWSDEIGNVRSKFTACVDVCNGGISINLDSPLIVATEIEVIVNPIDSASPKRKARVLRCSQQQSGWYLIGLTFD